MKVSEFPKTIKALAKAVSRWWGGQDWGRITDKAFGLLVSFFAFLAALALALVLGTGLYCLITGQDMRSDEEIRWDEEKCVIETGNGVKAYRFEMGGHTYIHMEHLSKFREQVVHDPDCLCWERRLRMLLDDRLILKEKLPWAKDKQKQGN
ncbi:MAG: hypothetical protein J6Y62_07195 [Clostridia bacterium]|nr:hypothetical protein [Clostridia bacterium]